MTGIGTAINVVAVLVGGGIGTLVRARLPETMRRTAMQAIGIVTLLVGVRNFLVLATASTHGADLDVGIGIVRRSQRSGDPRGRYTEDGLSAQWYAW
jgi:uncharacterized membrane protein YqgA involved in biofilm formation